MYFYDTSALLKLGDSVLDSNFMISYDTITELENITTNGRVLTDNRSRAKKILSILNKNRNKYQIVNYSSDFDEYFADKSKVVPDTYRQYVIKNKCEDLIFVTNNLSVVEYVTNELKLPVLNTNVTSISDIDNYKGWKEIEANNGGNEIVAAYFESRNPNYVFEKSPYMNEYLIVKDGDDVIQEMKWDGTKYRPIVYTDIKSEYHGKVHPLNVHQKLAFDLLQDDSITTKLLLGVYGSGKDFLMITHALKFIESGKYEKIVWIRNNIDLKDSRPIGYLPGDSDEKVMPYAGPLMDHIGGKEGLERAIMDRVVELLPLGYARGRDLDNTIIICSEAENLTTEHVQLLIGRVGKNSTLWFNGDTRQVDDHVFEANSGIERMIKKLSGQKKFGYVYMPITERSETAAMADLLD